MGPVGTIVRRCLKILGWLGCGLSALLFAGTLLLWVRSLGHSEGWWYERFEPRPDWKSPELVGTGTGRGWWARAMRGRLWLGSSTGSPEEKFEPFSEHRREPISADGAKRAFESAFLPGERPWGDGTARAWRFAGMSFRHRRDAVDPRIGVPSVEDFTLALPFWMPAILLGLGPAIVLLRWIFRKKRFAAGLCPHCGYDLRATPDRCPECGKAAGVKS